MFNLFLKWNGGHTIIRFLIEVVIYLFFQVQMESITGPSIIHTVEVPSSLR